MSVEFMSLRVTNQERVGEADLLPPDLNVRGNKAVAGIVQIARGFSDVVAAGYEVTDCVDLADPEHRSALLLLDAVRRHRKRELEQSEAVG